jgi:hypothetical protein
MHRRTHWVARRAGLVAGLAACACFTAPVETRAADSPEVAKLKTELTATQGELSQTRAELSKTQETVAALAKRVDAMASAPPQAASYGGAGAPTARLSPVNADNPAISFVVDTALQTNTHGDGGVGFSLLSGELFISAPIDPFVRGYASINGTSDEGFDVEEAALVTTALPWNLTVKGGRFFSDVGRFSHWHNEALPFVDRPPSIDRLIGGESRSEGVELSWLAPIEHFVQITGGVYNSIGEQEGAEPVSSVFGRRSFSELTWLIRPQTYFDLTDTLNVEVGGTYFGVPQRRDRNLYGVDVTVRHQPGTSEFYQGTTFGVEWMWNDEKFADQRPRFDTAGAPLLVDPSVAFDPSSNPQVFGDGRFYRQGGYAYFESFFGRRFSAGMRFDYSEAPSDDVDVESLYTAPLSPNADRIRTYSAFVTYLPSEFQRLRLQLDQIVAQGQKNDQRVTLQWTAFLGSHSHGFSTR